MKKLYVTMEKNSIQMPVGNIIYENVDDATFGYEEEYLSQREATPISISLPLQEERFSASRTRNFFEGLLPEGFARQSVAKWIHVDENDYISLLYELGRECLGAIQIYKTKPLEDCAYEKLSKDQVKALAEEGTSKSAQIVIESHLSLTGASGKVGLYYDAVNKEWYLPKGSAPSTHIVKQSHIRLKEIVTNEQLSLLCAKFLGIPIPHSFIVNLGAGKEDDILFATERYDRIFDPACRMINGRPAPLRLHQEDFAQALGIPSKKKYEENKEGYLSSMFNIVRNYCLNPLEDQKKLWKMIIFDFLIGNTDNHIKNYSLLYGKNMETIHLAPAYDRVSTVIYERITRNMALSIGGEVSLDRITENSFRTAAKEAGLGEKMAMEEFTQMADRFEKALREAAVLLQEEGFPGAADIRDRIMRTGGIAQLLK